MAKGVSAIGYLASFLLAAWGCWQTVLAINIFSGDSSPEDKNVYGQSVVLVAENFLNNGLINIGLAVVVFFCASELGRRS